MDYERELAYAIMDLDPLKDPNNDHRQHIGFYPYMFEISSDIHLFKKLHLENRKKAMRKLLEEDMRFEDQELRKIGKAYQLMQP